METTTQLTTSISSPSSGPSTTTTTSSLMLSAYLPYIGDVTADDLLYFSQSTFPSTFKHASVTPLLKKPGLDPSISANFRPISNLNNISKILGRLFLTRLQPHIALSSSFNPLQSAYRKHHSTETSLILDSTYHAADIDGRLAILYFSLLTFVLPFVPLIMLFFSIVSLLVLTS